MIGLASCTQWPFQFFIGPFPAYPMPSCSPAIQSYHTELLQ